MAEATGLRNNALPYPVYGAPFGITVPILDADGDLVTGAASLDSEVSKNGDTFADCTNEATEIATSSGMYYLLLTATEMTADVVAVIVKTGTAGAKTTPIVLYPRKLVTLRSGTVGANASDGTTLQLDSSAVAIDDYYNGCLLVGTLDSNVEARIISDYAGSTKVCTVSPAFVTTPDNNDTFVVYLPEGKQVEQADLVGVSAVAVSTSTAQLGVNAVQAGGTAWGSGAITAGSIAADAITAAKIANGAIDAATFAADVDAEILGYLVDDATRIDASALNTLSGHDPGETIMGATDLGTGSGLTSLATAAELAKVPKSDSNVSWNATAAAQIQSEANDALVAYDPPTKAELDSAVAPLALEATAQSILTDTAEIGVAGAGLTAADDAVLAAIAALNNLSSAGAQAAAAAALTAYSAATSTNVSNAQTAILAKLPSALSSNGNIKADVLEVNNTPLTGDGSVGTPWGPA